MAGLANDRIRYPHLSGIETARHFDPVTARGAYEFKSLTHYNSRLNPRLRMAGANGAVLRGSQLAGAFGRSSYLLFQD
jgi:hypothetical protein